MKIETRITNKGKTFILKNGEELTPSTDLYFVIVKDGEKVDSKSVKSITEAGEIAQSYEAFIKYYIQN